MPSFNRSAARSSAATGAVAYYEWMLAGRYLRARRTGRRDLGHRRLFARWGSRSASRRLTIVMAVMNGFRQELLGKIFGVRGHIMVEGSGGALEGWGRVLASNISHMSGVTAFDADRRGPGAGVSRRRRSGATGARQFAAAICSRCRWVAKSLEEGTLQRFRGRPTVIVGRRLADRMGLLPGMNITWIAPRGDVTTPRRDAAARRFTRSPAKNAVGMSGVRQRHHLHAAARSAGLFQHGHRVSKIEIMLKDADQVKLIDEQVARAAPQGRGWSTGIR